MSNSSTEINAAAAGTFSLGGDSSFAQQIKEAHMQTRQLGNSDLRITPIGFGAWAIGGAGWSYAWGSQDDKEFSA